MTLSRRRGDGESVINSKEYDYADFTATRLLYWLFAHTLLREHAFPDLYSAVYNILTRRDQNPQIIPQTQTQYPSYNTSHHNPIA